jgi:Transcriptional regulatory protein, C terminal
MLQIYLQIHETIVREALEELLPQAGICIKGDENKCDGILFTSSEGGGNLPSLNFFSLSRPLRFRELLSHLENLPYSQEITFAHFSLDLREKILKNLKTQETLRLTEKECQLLRFFHQNKGQDLSKDRLLKEIWEYHPEAETHTLETHIYRLRKKLEEDPNTPQIILNGKEGYWIK